MTVNIEIIFFIEFTVITIRDFLHRTFHRDRRKIQVAMD